MTDAVVGTATSPPRGTVRVADRALAIGTAGLLVGATVLALWLRIVGLSGWDGTLSVDEARLALAGRGILEHGVPILPSGWLYTRGLLAAYPVAASFALLGPSDFAARLPSVLAGAALVPVTYLLGRALAGRAGGLFAALFIAIYPPLVVWSRQAWFYALYVLVYTAALLFIVRAHHGGRTRDQLLAGGLVGLSFFAHELGVFLLVPLAAQILIRLWRDRRSPRCWRAPVAALVLALAAAALLALLVVGLRAETQVGPGGEFWEYLSPHLEGVPFRFYGRMLLDRYGLVLACALLGVPLAIARRRSVGVILWLALLPPFLHAVTIIPDDPQERYGLTIVVVLVLIAAHSVDGWASWLARRRPRISAGTLAALTLAVVLLVHQDIGRALQRGALSPNDGAWLHEARALGVGPEDLIMSDVPTVVGWYVGDVDYWVSSRPDRKYVLSAGDRRRDVHTGAELIRNTSDFRRLVSEPHRGRPLWVLASGRSYQWEELVDDAFRRFLERSTSGRINPADRSRILRIDL